jgi:hypothetical protein
MEYKGKLYGKIGGIHFETGKTSEDLDNLEAKVNELQEVVNKNCTIPGVMPRRLTAENGAKGLLIGEFHETIVCHDDEGEPYEVKMPVEWDTIKSIYAKIVEHYGA